MSSDKRDFWGKQFQAGLPVKLSLWWSQGHWGYGFMRTFFLELDPQHFVRYTDGGYDRESIASYYGRFSGATQALMKYLQEGTDLEKFLFANLETVVDLKRSYWQNIHARDTGHPGLSSPWCRETARNLGFQFVDFLERCKNDPLIRDQMSCIRDEARRHNAASKVLSQ